MFGVDPVRAIGGESPGGDEQMDVGMIEHGARPGVEHGQAADACADDSGDRAASFCSAAAALRISSP